jgi:hypothetical protein
MRVPFCRPHDDTHPLRAVHAPTGGRGSRRAVSYPALRSLIPAARLGRLLPSPPGGFVFMPRLPLQVFIKQRVVKSQWVRFVESFFLRCADDRTVNEPGTLRTTADYAPSSAGSAPGWLKTVAARAGFRDRRAAAGRAFSNGVRPKATFSLPCGRRALRERPERRSGCASRSRTRRLAVFGLTAISDAQYLPVFSRLPKRSTSPFTPPPTYCGHPRGRC